MSLNKSKQQLRIMWLKQTLSELFYRNHKTFQLIFWNRIFASKVRFLREKLWSSKLRQRSSKSPVLRLFKSRQNCIENRQRYIFKTLSASISRARCQKLELLSLLLLSKDLVITRVVVLGLFVWSMPYQLPPQCYPNFFLIS